MTGISNHRVEEKDRAEQVLEQVRIEVPPLQMYQFMPEYGCSLFLSGPFRDIGRKQDNGMKQTGDHWRPDLVR
jgi:hypothetical protein